MRRIIFLPNMITAFGLSCGLLVIFKMTVFSSPEGFYQILHNAVILLLLAAFADFVDGAVARALKAESEFGFNFDSLADSISFGVVPSVIFLKSLSLQPGSIYAFIAIAAAIVFSLCGVLRLVRYNVMKTKQTTQNPEELLAQKKHFTGLPIPGAAIAAVSVNFFLLSPFASFLPPITLEARAVILSSIMVLLGYFMVCRWKFPSLKALNFRLASFDLAFLAGVFAIFVLYGILYFLPIVLLLVGWGYVIVSWILSVIRLVAGKKSKTLEDFEPAEDFDDNDPQ